MEVLSEYLVLCCVGAQPPSQDKWPEQQEASSHTPGQGPALPFLAEPSWVCPPRQGGVIILEGVASQNSGHFFDQIVLLFPSPSPHCFDRCLAGPGKPDLVLAPSSS